MTVDVRSAAAKYYDLNPDFPRDVPFYLDLIPSPEAAVLELGCGTGRVTIPLARRCRLVCGLDLSPAMIRSCRVKLDNANLPPERVLVSEADVTNFDLGRRFDLVLAPFRVFQNLETDAQVEGLFRCVRKHLAPGGTCVLNVFKPLYEPDELRDRWLAPEEQLDWEVSRDDGKVACYSRRRKLDEQRLILYPDLVYRRYEGGELVEAIILRLVMRCYYPDTFEELISSHGFRIVDRWGGYAGEVYGEGPELVVQFESDA